MTPEAKRQRAAYMREWRRRHPEKTREYEAKKWQKKADAEAARAAHLQEIGGNA